MQKGIVISNISNLYKVEVNNDLYDCGARGKIKNEKVSPVAGDWVEIEVTDKEKKVGTILSICNRKNYIIRPKMANLTQIILVLSMKMPKPDLLLLDKQLAYAEYMNILPIICLNKIDLVDNEEVERIYDLYKGIGYEVIKTNAKEKDGIVKLESFLKNNITALSGNSGVGKSTLLNSILGTNVVEEGNISERNKKGKNTTTQVSLYKIEENSYIADTPGFSTFDIYDIRKENLAKYFKEFLPYIEKCEYGDCSHIKETKCGIKLAVEKGQISTQRYERYCQIYNVLQNKKIEYK